MVIQDQFFAVYMCAAVFGTAVVVVTLGYCLVIRRRASRFESEQGPGKITTKRSDLWKPQPERFQIQEHQLLSQIESKLIIERVHQLRFLVDLAVDNLIWHKDPANGEDFDKVFLDHDYKLDNTFQSDTVKRLFSSIDTRKFALAYVVSWLIATNISLEHSPEWNLLSPGLVRIANASRGDHLGKITYLSQNQTCVDRADRYFVDDFGRWSYEKTRVYICKILWPNAAFSTVLEHELSQPPPNKKSFDKLMGLLRELVQLYGEVDEQAKKNLRRPLTLGSRLGLLIHSDLQPWELSFCLCGKPNRLPALGEAASPQAIGEGLFTPDDDFVLHPALVAIGNKSGLHETPEVVVEAVYQPKGA